MVSENDLVQNNLGLVIKIADSFNPRTQSDLEDYIQVGCIGLLKAIRKYSEAGKTKLSTFAWKSIHWEILRHIRKNHKHKDDMSLCNEERIKENSPIPIIEEYLPDTLSDNERRIILLKSRGYSTKEISAALSLSRGWVHILYNKAVKKMEGLDV